MSIFRIRRAVLAFAGVALTVPVVLAATAPASVASSDAAMRTPAHAPTPPPIARMRAACPNAPAGYVRCFALYRPQTSVNRAIAAGVAGQASRPIGLTPKEIEAAYRLPINRNSHQTVAVSIAYNTPRLAKYLAVYRRYFGLPPCTVKSGCFRQVNQRGKASPLPPSGVGSGWDLEATLDVSMISVACPHCKIVVVEGFDPSFGNMARTEDAAAGLGAEVISNSYGGRENGYALVYAKAYHHPGHTIVVSAGDYGYTAANFPADLSTVTAAGGTILARAHTKRGWWERAWLDLFNGGAGGSGCSAYVSKPPWQHDPHCPGRTVSDVSAVASNIPIYNKDYGGWITVGGTSVAAPLIAGIYGLAGNASVIPLGYAYSHRRDLFDVTHGNNALFVPAYLACGNDYLCVAKKGYDAPTGLGTPDGIGAF
jgi:subtilase family serine protease